MKLNGSLEDNILTLLCYSDIHAAAVALQTPPELFSTKEYRRIAEAAHAHLERYSTPPKNHLRDILEKQLRRGEEGILLRRTIEAMEQLAPELQAEYVLEQLDRFITIRKMTMAVEEAADALNRGDVEKATEALYAQEVVHKAVDGIWVNDPERMLGFMTEDDGDFFSSGIDTLDDMGIFPRRKTMTVLIGSAKAGKSWFLIEVAKRGLMHRKKVLHITLENSQDLTAQRYVQSLLAMASDKKDESVRIPVFTRDSLGRCTSIDYDQLAPEIIGKATHHVMSKKLRAVRGRLLIKEFPTSTLTIAQYNAYLDMLARTENFVPDLVVLDYPDLMHLDSAQLRIDTGSLFRKLRGTAIQRNHALVTVTQGNRASGTARVVTTGMVAEDWSKIGTADTVLTYAQTPEERELGLGRVLVAAARHARDKFLVLISQSYATGQFCLDSCYMSKFMESEVDRLTGKGGSSDGDSTRGD